VSTVFILYLPVIHDGYLLFLGSHRASRIFLLGHEFIDELAEHVEIRSLDPETAACCLSALDAPSTKVLDREILNDLRRERGLRIITPDERITRKFIGRYFPETDVTFERTFLRWEESNVFSLSDVPFDRVSKDSLDQERMKQAVERAEQGSDWWRRVGALLVTKTGVVFKSNNEHLPTEYTPYINGDPRDSIKAGMNSEFSSSLHAEKGVLAQALVTGTSTLGADLYVSVFPCPGCAKLVAFSGVKRLFFQSGHASLDGVDNLKHKGVEIIKVE
jgi:dCMP deaminase